MRALVWFAGILVVLYSGYWFVGQRAMLSGTEAFFANASEQGLVAENRGITVQGFPSRFDLTVTDPRLANPRAGVEWQAPFVQILTLSYRPWHVIAAFAQTQSFTTPTGTITLTNQKLQASLVVTPGPSLTLNRTTLVGSDVMAVSTLGWTLSAGDLRLATKIDPSLANTYDIGVEVADLTPDPALTALMPDLPRVIDLVRLDANASFSAPIDRFAPEKSPLLTALTIRQGQFNWGSLQAYASGDLTVVAGVPEGRIDLSVRGWRDLVALMLNTGAIKPEIAPTALTLIEAYAAMSGDPDVLEMPLVFAAGQMSLGPLPLGPAPRLN
jgi:hypothetical protein